jgi:hypothetical protein
MIALVTTDEKERDSQFGFLGLGVSVWIAYH